MENRKSVKSTNSKGEGARKQGKEKAGPKMREVRKRAVAVMCPKVTGIAKKLTEMAEQGNCQAAKLVFEFLGIYPPPQAGRERRHAGAVPAAAIGDSRSSQRRGNYEGTERRE